MATGVLASPPIFPTSSGINPALDSRSFNFFPYAGGAMASKALAGSLAFVEPVIPTRTGSGAKATSFGDDWFNRIHVTPALIALGNLVSNLTKTFNVWNAWLGVSRTLSSISSANSSGITVTPPGALPQIFTPNQELAFTVAISTNGPATINALYTLLFTDAEAPTLAITGTRITGWALTPDWSDPVIERLEFLTDVMHAWSGAEQRRALRIAPRRFFDFRILMTGRERRYLESQLFAWSSRVWALPVWPDGQLLPNAVSSGAISLSCDTVNRDFVQGGMAIFIMDALTYEVVQIQSFTSSSIAFINPVQNNWGAGTKFYPVRAARFAGYPKISRGSGNVAEATPAFQVIDASDWPAASGLPSYRGLPVLEMSPDEGGLESTYARDTATVDGGTGAYSVDDRAGVGLPNQSLDWFLTGRTTRAAFRSLLYLLKGRQAEIWVPTYQNDIKLASDVTSVQTTVDVDMVGYTLYLVSQVNRQDARIELLNGTIFYRRITGSVVLDSRTERLSLDSGLGTNVAMTDVRRISFMALSRMGSDSISIDHHNAADGLATARTLWQALNRNV